VTRRLVCVVAAGCAAAALTIVPARAAAAPGPHLSGTAAALIEETTGQQLYASNANAQRPIASTTKLMTALLTLEQVRRLSTSFTQNDFYPAAADSQISLVPGERMSVHDLLLAMLLPSADDAAEDLAYNVGHGSVPQFVAMMNVRARELGLTDTHYSTPIGLDTPGNYSSAADLVKLARHLLIHEPFFARSVRLPAAVLRTGNHVRAVVNRNDLVGRVPWVNGVKTGHTTDAGYVMVGSGTRDGMTLISAVLGASSAASRDANTLALLDYGFANFRLARPIVAAMVLARPPGRDQPALRPAVIAAGTVTAVVPRTAAVSIMLQLPHELVGPLARHTVVGTAVVLAGGRTIARVPLRLASAVPAVSPLTVAARLIARPFTLVLLAVLFAAAIALILRRRMRGRDSAGPEPA
jgi:serine-type D-Ala-D-Ala carboxypeptidase (penicillin-binding protein 5/6)